MRAVAYTEALQTVRPRRRLAAADRLRPQRARRLGRSCGRCSGPRCSTCGSRSCPPASRARGRRSRKPAAWPGTSTATIRGSACCSARRSSASGTGAPTSTSCSARSARPTRRRRGAAPSSRPFLKLLPVFIFIIPGMIALALAKTGQGAGARRRWSTRPASRCRPRRRALPAARARPAADRRPRRSSSPGCSPRS